MKYVWILHDNDRGNDHLCKLYRNKKDAVKLFNVIADEMESQDDGQTWDKLEIDRKRLVITYDATDSWGMIQIYKEEIL